MRIAFVGQEEYFKIHYENDLDYKYEVFRMDFHYHMASEDFDKLRDFRPDYTFFFRGEFVPNKVIRTIPGVKIAISSEPFPKLHEGVLHSNESFIERMETFLAIDGKGFDYIFHYDALSLPILERIGARISGAWAFPIATRRVLNYAHEEALIPKVNGQLDFFFAGRSTAHREKFFGHLKHLYNFLHVESGVPGLNALPLARASKIVLNVHADEGISWEPRLQFFLAAGCFVMSETISPNRQLSPGKHYVEFAGPAQLHELVKHYLADEPAREAIAAAGQAQVSAQLSAVSSYEALIQGIQAGKYPRPSFNVKGELIAALRFHAKYPETDYIKNRFVQFNELID